MNELLPFRIKICGLTVPEDASMVSSLGGTCIGLNFSQHSVRQVSEDVALKIVAAFRNGQAAGSRYVVGVFVEQSVREASEIANRVGLDVIQLHGDHSLQDVQHSDHPVIWVRRIRSDGPESLLQSLRQIAKEVQQWRASLVDASRLMAVLLDAHVQGQWGGTGATLAWQPLGQRWMTEGSNLAGQTSWPTDLPLILAGGLGPENILEAVSQAKPDAVDLASGVEFEPGRKSPQLVQQVLDTLKTWTVQPH